ncbi:MAG TPA: hypothetical protein V6D00_12770 [Pantanalinema sp.]
MEEDLIWLEPDLDTIDAPEDHEWSQECEHFVNGECLQYGAPCPAMGNVASIHCLFDDAQVVAGDPEFLEAS